MLWGGWLRRHRPDVQLHGRHLPRLLHGRAGPGDRRPGRHGRRCCCGAAGDLVATVVLAGDGRRSPRSGRRSCSDAAADFADLARRRRCWSSGWSPRSALVAVALFADRMPRVSWLPRVATAVVLGAGVAAALAGPAAYALDTASHRPHRFDPDRRTGGGRQRSRWARRARRARALRAAADSPAPAAATPRADSARAASAVHPARPPGARPTAARPGRPAPPGGQTGPGQVPADRRSAAVAAAGGGLLNASTPSAELIAALQANADPYTWVARRRSARNNAAGLPARQPRSRSCRSAASTAATRRRRWPSSRSTSRPARSTTSSAAAGSSANGGSQSAQQIAAWVPANFTATTVGGQTVYDLST